MGRKENKDYGKIIDYDPNWKGPLAIERIQTDFGFLVSLAIFFVVWIAVGVYAFTTGEIKQAIKNQTMTTQVNSSRMASSSMNPSPSSDNSITYIVLGFILLGIILSFTFLYLLRHFPKGVVFTAIFVYCLVLLIAIGISAWRLATHKKGQDSDPTFGLAASGILFVVSIIVLIVCRKKIIIACGVVKESAKAVMFFPSSFLFPLLPLILYGITIAFFGFTFACLSSNPSMSRQNSTTAHLYLFHGINIFGLLWSTNFIYAFSQMVLSGAFATWYWTMDKERVPSYAILKFIGVTTRFHLGTLAFGSLIIAVVQAIKMLAKTASNRERESGDNFGAILLSCFARICDALEEVLEYINHNAYVMCTIHGTNFIQSAKDAFNLLMRNAMTVLAVTNVTSTILFLGELVVVGLSLLGTYACCRNMNSDDTITAMLLVGFSTFFISLSMFEVLKTAINTIFLCVLEDYERNDGSIGRPYFMPLKLRELLIKDA